MWKRGSGTPSATSAGRSMASTARAALSRGSVACRRCASARDWSAGRLSLPEDDEQERMYLEGIRLLAAHGLEQYEISNYARPGFFSRHNMGYWTGADYLGLGPAATSTLEGRRWTDTPEQARWQADIDAGRPDHDAEAITPRIRLEERLMLSLRTCAGFGLAEYTSLSDRDFMALHP